MHAQQRRLCHGDRLNAVCAPAPASTGAAEVERVGIEEEAERHRKDTQSERHQPESVLRRADRGRRHGANHTCALHDSGEGSRREEDAGHEDCGWCGVR